MRLIDADALIERCNGMIADKWNSKVAPVSWANAYADFIDDVDDCPTVELPRWIPVTKRLPEKDVPILVIAHGWGNDHHDIYVGSRQTVKGSDGSDNFFGIPRKDCEWSIWGWSYLREPNVTHWMPLPKPPKEGET